MAAEDLWSSPKYAVVGPVLGADYDVNAAGPGLCRRITVLADGNLDVVAPSTLAAESGGEVKAIGAVVAGRELFIQVAIIKSTTTATLLVQW